MTERAELFAQFTVVVDLAVVREDVATVVREHRLVTGGTGVDYREAAVAQADAPVVLIDRFGNPNAVVVTPTMLDSVEHLCNPWFGVEADDSGDATHFRFQISVFQISNGWCSRSESRIRKVARVVAVNSFTLIGGSVP